MPVFHTFTAGGKRYMFDANTNVIINLKEDLYFELEKYMQSGYKEITPAIEKLRDRGYLKDRADFEMVHPMDSTLEYSLERCIGTIALQVTQGCNLRCKYCAYSGSYDNRVHSSKRMSKEIAFKAIDFLFDHSIDRDRVSLGFYGGEPLLELDLIKECVKYAKKKSIGKELMFNITSNTTLITDEVLKFLYDNEFSLTVSLDGDRQAHDKNRVFAANGAGTFSVVMQILEKKGVPTHFVKELSDRETAVKKVTIVPLEVIIRNRAAGSICKRLGLEEGMNFVCPSIEFSYKDDDLGDPLINGYHAVSCGFATQEDIDTIKKYAFKVNEVLKEYFLSIGVELIDFKLEFGKTSDGTIVLADEISPDTCRFWDSKTHEKLDKDRFRRDLGGVEDAYAEMMKRVGLD